MKGAGEGMTPGTAGAAVGVTLELGTEAGAIGGAGGPEIGAIAGPTETVGAGDPTGP